MTTTQAKTVKRVEPRHPEPLADSSSVAPPRSTHVLLIGAGPIGIEMAAALQEAGLDYLHVEAQQIGHTISWFPRQTRFFSGSERIAICGVPLLTPDQSKATREEYLTYLLSVVQQFELKIQTYERVVAVSRHEGAFRVETTKAGQSHHYRAEKLIWAVGDMHRPRVLEHPGFGPVPGANLPHVSSYFVEPHPYVGQDLLVVGGRNSAVEAAIRCHRAGARVALSYRRQELDSSIKYWLKPEIDSLIQSGAIKYFGATVPIEITAQSVQLAPVDDSGAVRADGADHDTLPIDFVLCLIGYQMDTRLLEMAGVELLPPNGRPRLSAETQETNVPGLYVAGTASAGTQLRYRLFIENCHSHVVRIARHLTGKDPRRVNPMAYTRLDESPFAAES